MYEAGKPNKKYVEYNYGASLASSVWQLAWICHWRTGDRIVRI